MTDELLYGFIFGDPTVEKYILSSLKKRTPAAKSEKTWINFFNSIRAKYVYSVNALIKQNFPCLTYQSPQHLQHPVPRP
jgi:hypothetical protein